MADAGYRADEGLADALRMQQLKMQLRMTINAILDARVHAHGMTEDEAMALMMERGHQEEGEAAGKWRRALLTSAQLSTYFVGYVEVARPGPRPGRRPARRRRCASATTRCSPTAPRPRGTCAPCSASEASITVR